MTGTELKSMILSEEHIVLDMRDSFTCSFTEFFPFCVKLFYFSSLKAF
jgi:hypothetical protein